MAKHLELNLSWCKGCGICAEFCPRKVLKMEKGKVSAVNLASCVSCGICEKLCPDFAIYLVEGEAVKA